MRLSGVVNAELHRDDDVVLHAAYLAAEGGARLGKHVDCLLELQRVDGELLVQPPRVRLGVAARERLQ